MYETLKLSPGILTLTCVAPPEGDLDAMIRPIVPPGSRHAITLMFEPGNVSGALTRAGAFCVIRCGQAAVLGLEIRAERSDGPPRGGIELNYLSQTGSDPEPIAGHADYVLHLAGYGDRPARFGTLTGGDAGQAIAGLMMPIRASTPRIMLQDPVTGQVATPGEYLGSQSGFRPLSELRAWIEAPDGRQRLALQADFAEAGRVESRGTMVSLHGAGPEDRLLRLSMALEAMPLLPEAEKRPERIRIFRKS
ncbi:hypothetical protein [Gemmobacter serpentinus]|uniref:hypothetical protein n=1 Tax=Gemmobacter serpentinus TaxID=2652247 RepID=UPI00124E0784|nr:hypothetical protein [Gemmobacter serpentinus]